MKAKETLHRNESAACSGYFDNFEKMSYYCWFDYWS